VKKLSLLLFLPWSGVMLVVACGGDDTQPPKDAGTTPKDVTEEVVPDAGPDAPPDAPRDTGPPLPHTGQVDRLGRAAIIEALMDGIDKEGYNRADTFTLVGGDGGTINREFQSHLVNLDLLDGVDNWDGGSPEGSLVTRPNDAGPDAPDGSDAGTTTTQVFPHPAIPLLRNDVLLVDSAKPFSTAGYLEIEFRALSGAPGTHTTCGGRWMNDDAVDKTMSLIVKKSLSGVSDGVDQATTPATLVFPYLAPPN